MQIFLTLVVIAIAVWYSTREHRRQLRNLKAWESRLTHLGPPSVTTYVPPVATRQEPNAFDKLAADIDAACAAARAVHKG